MGRNLRSRAGRARRRDLELRSTPVQAVQDSPKGWEKPPGRLGRTSKFRDQPFPPPGRAAEQGSQGCGSGSPGHCDRTPLGGRTSEDQAFCPTSNSPKLAKGSQTGAQVLQQRGRWAGLPEWLFSAQNLAPAAMRRAPALHTSAQHTQGSGDARLPGHSKQHAGTTRRGRTAFPRPGSRGASPLPPSASGCKAGSSRPHPRPLAPEVGPHRTHPRQGPSARPRG